MWVICKLVDAKTGGQIGPEKFQESQSFGALFHLVVPSELIVKKVYLSKNGKPSDTWTAAELTHPISLSSQFGKPYVKFIVDKAEPVHTTVENAVENALDRLMASVRRFQWEKQQSAQPPLPAPRHFYKIHYSTRFTQKDAMYNEAP